MSYTKSAQEIALLKEGGKIMGEILADLVRLAHPGVSTIEIDEAAETMIRDAGGIPAFKGYKPRGIKTPFPGTICASLNEEVVHGIPTRNKVLKNGDVFTLDIGMIWPARMTGAGNQKSSTRSLQSPGLYTDTAVTVAVGKIGGKAEKLMEVTREALEAGIAVCRPGNTIADIGRAVEDFVTSHGRYGIVRDLCGHGVGHAVHEEPYVLNYYDKSLEAWELKPGVVIAIEPMITLGGCEVVTEKDEWTITTADKSLSAHYEHTVVITEGEPIVVTRRPGE